MLRGGLAAQWEWQDDDGVSWQPYSEAVSLYLEVQRTAGDATADLGGSQGWLVDYGTMEQSNTAFTGRKRAVRRVDLPTDGGGGGGGAAAAPVGLAGPPPPVRIFDVASYFSRDPSSTRLSALTYLRSLLHFPGAGTHTSWRRRRRRWDG